MLDRVLKVLEREGRTRQWLSQYCGISVETLNHYLSGRRMPRRPIIKLVAHALDTTEEYLCGVVDTPEPVTEIKATGT